MNWKDITTCSSISNHELTLGKSNDVIVSCVPGRQHSYVETSRCCAIFTGHISDCHVNWCVACFWLVTCFGIRFLQAGSARSRQEWKVGAGSLLGRGLSKQTGSRITIVSALFDFTHARSFFAGRCIFRSRRMPPYMVPLSRRRIWNISNFGTSDRLMNQSYLQDWYYANDHLRRGAPVRSILFQCKGISTCNQSTSFK